MQSMLTGAADIAMGGISPLMLLWDKTRGGQKIRGIMTMCESPVSFITVDPRIKNIRDFRDGDKIAMSAVKVTLQALFLEMAAVKAFGWEERFKLDPLAVSMSNPDGMTALLSGGSEVKTHATITPFTEMELAAGKARLLFTSDEILGGPSPGTVVFTTAAWKTENPKLYAALVAAFEDGIALIKADKRKAAEIYLRFENTRQSVEEVTRLLENEGSIRYSSTPHGVMAIADFMYRIGTLHTRPESWQELFWENVRDRPGN